MVRKYIWIGLLIFFLWAIFAGLTAQAHTTEGINDWEEDWTALYEEAEDSPLAPMLIYELERARFWWEYRHQCFYHDICLATPPPAPKRTPIPWEVNAGVEQWRSLVSQYFSEADRALCIMWYESKGNPNAYNASTASGLMQVKQFWFDKHGGNPFDPANNLRVAAIVLATQGWTAWSPYNRGLCR